MCSNLSKNFILLFVLMSSVEYVVSVNGQWGQWSVWYSCTTTCGYNGYKYRQRHCNNPTPTNGGMQCPGDTNGDNFEEERNNSCSQYSCQGDGNWGLWSDWNGCTKTCGGGGARNRQRNCNKPAPSPNGNYCFDGSSWTLHEHQYDYTCGNLACPVDGHWTIWSVWSSCTVTCDGGNRTRERNCKNPTPEHGGRNCIGSELDYDNCSTEFCPVDGNWTSWSKWSHCTASIGGGGNRTRGRNCTNPSPIFGGKSCSGDKWEYGVCSLNDCPVTLNSKGDSRAGIVGSIMGAVVVVLMSVVIILIVLLKRKSGFVHRKEESKASYRVEQAGGNVIFRPESTNQDDAYLTIERVGGLPCTDSDYDELHVAKDDIGERERNKMYCNMALDDSPEFQQ